MAANGRPTRKDWHSLLGNNQSMSLFAQQPFKTAARQLDMPNLILRWLRAKGDLRFVMTLPSRHDGLLGWAPFQEAQFWC